MNPKNQLKVFQQIGSKNLCYALFLLLVSCLGVKTVLAQCTAPQTLVHWNMDACGSSYSNYSEFTAVYPSGCAGVSATTVYRDSPNTYTHSCVAGYTGAAAMCVSGTGNNVFGGSSAYRVKFSTTVNTTQPRQITALKFYARSPAVSTTLSGTSNPNNYLLKYGVRIFKGTTLVFESIDLPLSNSWQLQTLNLSTDSDFQFSANTTYNFELTAYQPYSTGSTTRVWDLDDIKIEGCCGGNTSPDPTLLVEYSGACNDTPDSFSPINVNTCLTAGDLAPSNGNTYSSCQGGIVCFSTSDVYMKSVLTAAQNLYINRIDMELLFPIGSSSNSGSCTAPFNYKVEVYKNGSLQTTVTDNIPVSSIVSRSLTLPTVVSAVAGNTIEIRLIGLPISTSCDLFEIQKMKVIGGCGTTCNNVTSAGVIGYNESGVSPFNPSIMVETTAPAGGSGAFEYIWQQSTNGGATWTDIAGANASSYDPASITVTTLYRRAVRRAGCTTWLYSNTITKTITGTPTPTLTINDVTVTEGANSTATLQICASAASISPMTVVYSTSNVTAAWNTDYIAATATATIPAGQTCVNVTIGIVNDFVLEPTETFNINLSSSVGATIGDAQGIVTILDNDATTCNNYTTGGTIAADESGISPFNPSIIVETAAPIGGSGTTEYKWQQSIDGGTTWTDIVGGTSANYDPTSITVTTKYRRSVRRANCTAWLNSNIVTKTVAAPPTLTINDITVTEGVNPTVAIQICASYPPYSPVTVQFTTTNGTAIAGSDYTTTTGAAAIPAGQLCATVTIQIIDNTTIESTETFTVTLSSPVGATIADAQGIVTILDNDATTCNNYTTGGTIAADESGASPFNPSNITETIAPTGGSGTTEYKWQQSTDGGTTWTDIASSNTVNYDPASITVTTKYRRSVRRADCAAWLNSNVVTKTVTTAALPVITITDGSKSENSITGEVTLLVCVTPANSTPVTIEYATADGTATGGVDYVIKSGTVTLNPGTGNTNCTYIYIYILNDTAIEPTEQFTVNLSNPVGAIIGDGQSIITIGDDDTACYNYYHPGNIVFDESGVAPFNPSIIIQDAPAIGGAVPEYRWQQSTDNGTTWTDIAGATASNYDPSVITVTTQYRRQVRSVNCTTWLSSNIVTKTITIIGNITIGDKVFNDLNNNGIQDSGEPGIEGVQVNLFNSGGWVAYTVTGANGIYSFSSATNSSIVVGSYQVCFSPLWGLSNVSPKDQGGNDATDSDINSGASPNCTDFFAVSGGTYYNVDAGFNNGAPPSTPTVYASYITVTEGVNPTVALQICASYPPYSPVTVQFATANGTAIAGSDYTTTTGTATIPAGQLCTTVTIPIIDNTTIEPTETFSINLSNPIGATISNIQGVITILDNDEVICNNYSTGGTIAADESGVSPFNPSNITETVAPTGGTGTAEYKWQQSIDGGTTWTDIASSNTANYDPASITVTTKYRRSIRRANCTVWLTSNIVTKTVTTAALPVITITDGSRPEYSPSGEVTLLVCVTPANSTPVTIQYATSDGTATGGVDYVIKSGTVTLNPGTGNTNCTYIYIYILDDTVIEPTEQFTVNLSNPVGAVIGDGQSVITIGDDDSACYNYYYAGGIGYDESGVAPFNPSAIVPGSPPAGGAAPEYQWQQSTDNGATWTDIAGATASSYDPGIITVTTQYRRQIRGANCTAWLASYPVTKTVIVSNNIVIGDKVFNDLNNNGIQDSGEPGIEGVQINLFDSGGWVAYTVTGANGIYTFSSATNPYIVAGNYQVCFSPLWGLSNVSPKDQGGNDATDSDINSGASPNCTDFFAVTAGTNNNIDAGFNNGSAPTTPSLSINDVTVTEGANPTATLQICASATSSSSMTVQYTTVNGAATSGSDYTTTTGTATIPAWQLCTSVIVPIIDNTTTESTETFSVNLSSPVGATIADAQGVVTILDNDAATCYNYTTGGTIAADESGVSPFNPSNITETVAPTGGSGTTEYKWQQSIDGGTTWTDIASSNTVNYDPASITVTTKYRRSIRRANCTVWLTSNVVTKTVTTVGTCNNVTSSGSLGYYQANNSPYDPEPVVETAPATGGTGTLQYIWEVSNDNWSWTVIAGATGASYDPSTISITQYYRRGVRRANCTDYLYSASVLKHVDNATSTPNCDDVVGGTIGYDQAICAGGDPAPIVNITAGSTSQAAGIRYQWFKFVGPSAPADPNFAGEIVWGAEGLSYDPTQWQVYSRTWYRRCAGVNDYTCNGSYPGETAWVMVDVVCNGKSESILEPDLAALQLSPMPASSMLNIQFAAADDQNVTIKVIDLSGKVIAHQQHAAEKGDNIVDMDISTFIDGYYMVQITNSRMSQQAKLVVIH